MITKNQFVGAILIIQEQTAEDNQNAAILEQMFPGSNMSVYNNSKLIKGICDLLRIFFPRDEDGHCDIEHYCFMTEFGRYEGAEIISPEDLWDELNQKKQIA